MSYEDYVCGTRFQGLADVVIGQHGKIEWKDNRVVRYVPKVYCHTHDFRYVLDVVKGLAEQVILITHNSDGAVRNSLSGQDIGPNDADASLLPSNVIKWYAQNVEAPFHLFDEKIVPIPIGLENRYCFPYDKAEMLFSKDKNSKIKNDLYFNCNLRTNLQEREKALQACQLAEKNITIRLGANGEDYNAYLDDILAHRGVVSPRGNGLDCHRTWEALYLNRIPVMTYDRSLASFNLPIVFLNRWGELSFAINNIITEVEVSIKYIHTGIADMRALSMKYWEQRINYAE